MEKTNELKRTFKTNAICPKCGNFLNTTDISGYGFLCKQCDENFFSFEAEESGADVFKLQIPTSYSSFSRNVEELHEIAEDYGMDFYYEESSGIVHISWKNERYKFSCFDVIWVISKRLNRMFKDVISEDMSEDTPEDMSDNLLERYAGKWVYIKDGIMPPENTEVLICYQDKEDNSDRNIAISSYGYFTFGGQQSQNKGWKAPFPYFARHYKIVAWMPKPELPED